MAEKTLVYQLWPLSWGSIRLMTAFLPRIKALGADYVCLCPIYESPLKNGGYDVSDFFKINHKLGNLADFDEFVATAHIMHIKVILDLPIDSTSVEHNWFITEQHRYVTSKSQDFNRQNFLGYDLAWQQKKDDSKYYLALNHPRQATLNWFNGGVLNRTLLESFKKIMQFWMSHDVDGFRLEFAQLLNAVDKSKTVDDILIGHQAVTVINELSNLYGVKTPFLIMDCIDWSGDIIKFYSHSTDVEFFTSRALRNYVSSSASVFAQKINEMCKNNRFMVSLESHDVSRFISRTGFSAEEVLNLMFADSVQAVCIYQGQELGLENPDLSVKKILTLDPKKSTEVENGTKIASEDWHQESCANARAPIPLDEYARQEFASDSVLIKTKAAIDAWKSR